MQPSKFSFLLMLLGSLAMAFSASIVNADVEVLHHFSGTPGDGAAPHGSLLADGEVLYGVTNAGGQYDKGTLFSIQTDGSNYSSRYSFSATSGAGPRDFLVKDDSFLYGTTYYSGGGYGTVFKVRPSGSDFQVMHIFVGTTNNDGQQSLGGLFRDEENLYGMTIYGGSFDKGTVFRINKNDFDYEIMHSFSGEDGGQPQAALVGNGGTLYGTSALGGATYNDGTLFKIQDSGNGFKVLHAFGLNPEDGRTPTPSPLLVGSVLYGATQSGGMLAGGLEGQGVLYRIDTEGSNYRVLHVFSGEEGTGGIHNSLLLVGSKLYGMRRGGSYGQIFRINLDGSEFEVLHSFESTDGRTPDGALIRIGASLYGMCSGGGQFNKGTIFRYDIIPCAGDFDHDLDVDGSDLARLILNPALLDSAAFANEFGRTGCFQ